MQTKMEIENRNRIIIIDYEPYRKYKRQRFFLDEFLQHEFIVQYWCLCELLTYTRRANYLHKDKDDEVIYIKTERELSNRINILSKSTIVIMELGINFETLPIIRRLKSKSIITLRIDYFRNFGSILSRKSTVLEKMKKMNIFRIKNKIAYFIDKIYKFSQYDCLFLTGQKINNYQHPNIKSLTYFDVYTNQSVKEPILTEKYIVFLDMYFAKHPDWTATAGIPRNKQLSEDLYYQKMNKAFDKIESQTGIKIVVAAHPQSQYSNEYKHRQIFYNKTAELVKYSEFILTHHSLAISYAILNNKKIFLLFFDDFFNKKSYLNGLYLSMLQMQNEFDGTLINIDHDFVLHDSYQINLEKYTQFKKNYLYSDKYPLSNFEIVYNEIKRLKQER